MRNKDTGRWSQRLMIPLLISCLTYVPAKLEAQSWQEVLAAASADIATGDYFGFGVAIDGDYAIVSAPNEDQDALGGSTLNNAGSVYIFRRVLGRWQQQQKLVASDRAVGDRFGRAVDIRGDLAIVGAWAEDQDAAGVNTLSSAGSAYLFRRSGEVWSQEAKLVPTDRAASDYFGWSVAVDGDYALIGAKNEDEDENGANTLDFAGSAYVFYRDPGTGTWAQQQKLVASQREAQAYFGWMVDLDGDFAVIGAVEQSLDAAGQNSLNDAGAAYVFARSGTSWNLLDVLVPADRDSLNYFGHAVDISGTDLIVGAYGHQDARGAAYIYTYDGGHWTLEQKIGVNNSPNEQLLGTGVAINGDWALVGLLADDKDAVQENYLYEAGSAYLFRRSGGVWTEHQKVVPRDRGSAISAYGYHVALSGNRAVVGAYAQGGPEGRGGRAFFYEFPERQWQEVLPAVPDDIAAGDYFGFQVAMDGDYALVGSPNEDQDANGVNTLNNAGSAYFYQYRHGAWRQMQKIVPGDRGAGDRFGRVHLQGEVAIVGAFLEDEDENGANTLVSAGSAYIFRLQAGQWAEEAKLVASDRAASDNFGWDVAISGDYAIAGARYEDEDASGANTLASAGSAYIYHHSGGNWSEQQKLVAGLREANAFFGWSVALDGDYAAVGASEQEVDTAGANPLADAGAVYVYERSGTTWTLAAHLVAPDRLANALFGSALALSGDELVVGAPGHNNSQGAVYVFSRQAGTWTLTQTLLASDGDNADEFGFSVDIAGDQLIVGAEGDEHGGAGMGTVSQAGSAYLFTRQGGRWVETTKLLASDRGQTAVLFGAAVAVSDLGTLAGAYLQDGHGRVYFGARPAWTLPHSDYALEFDGLDDYAALHAMPPLGTAFTMEGWLRSSSLSATNDILTWGNQDAGISDYAAWRTDGGKLSFGAYVGSWQGTSSLSDVCDDRWHHIAVVRDGTALTLYVDGRQDQTGTFSLSPVVDTTLLGALWQAGSLAPGHRFEGDLDEVRLWTEARTEAQIQRDMHQQLAGDEAHLALYFNMYDSTGSSLSDVSSRGHPALLAGTPRWQASGAQAGPDQALDFDGVDDYVQVPPAEVLKISGHLTLEAWARFDALGADACLLLMGHDHDASSDYNLLFTLELLSDTTLQARWETGSGTETHQSTAVAPVSPGTWHHYALVRQATARTLTFYVDGAPLGLPLSYAADAAGGALSPLFIGAGYDAGAGAAIRPWDGQIDEVRIWAYARSKAQIRDQMFRSLSGQEADLVAYYRFDQQGAAGHSTLYDQTPYGHHGTLTHMAPSTAWVSGSPFNTWIGSDDSDWTLAANWSRDAVPGSEALSLHQWPGGEAPVLPGSYSAHHFYVARGLSLTHTGDLTLSGHLFNAGTLVNTGTVTLSGTEPQLIAGSGHTTFSALMVNNPTGVTLDQDIATTDLDLNAGLLAISDHRLAIAGQITLGSGGLWGDSASHLAFTGSGASTTLPPVTVGRLTLNRGQGISLGGAVGVGDSLRLDNGRLDLGAFDLTLGHGVIIHGGSPTAYVRSSSSGRLWRPVGPAPQAFPVGNSSYNPLILYNDGDSAALGVRVMDEVRVEGYSGAVVGQRVVNRTWFIEELAPGNPILSLRFQWEAIDELSNFDRTQTQVKHYQADAWTDEGSSGPAAGPDPYTFSVSGITSLSPFIIADEETSFPVEWLHFWAAPQDQQVALTWATAREENSAYFAIERSAESENWAEIGRKAAAGYAVAPQHYAYTDRTPLAGPNYYRLRQADLDGQYRYSPTVVVHFDRLALTVYPNPVQDYLQVVVAGPWTAELIDAQGRFLRRYSQAGQGTIDLRALPSGQYFLRIEAAGQRQNLALRKE